MKVAVLGHSALNIAPAVAADLAFRGIDVAWWPAPDAVRAAGGIVVRDGALHLDAQRTGLAAVRAAGDPTDAVGDAAAVILDIPPERLVDDLRAVAPLLAPGTVLHAQSHGYWPALRLAHALRRDDLVFTDSSAPTHAAGFAHGVLQPHWRRRGLRFSAVQGDPLPVLSLLYPGAMPAASALETGLEGINLMVHPALSLLNVAAFDRAAAAGVGFAFYGEGNTASTGVLASALDAERGRVCAAYGVRHRRLAEALRDYYGASGDEPMQAVATSAFYQGLGALPADSWRRWAAQDLPFAIIPLLRLAARAGVAAPFHQGLATIFGALLGADAERAAPTLEEFGLDGPDLAQPNRSIA